MEDTIRRLQNDFDEAELHADTEKLRELITDDFLSIGPKGFILDKEEWIARHVHFRYLALDTSAMDIRLYDKTALVRNIQSNRATYKDQETAHTVRVGQTWVCHDEQWRLAGIQFSPLAQD